MLVAAGVIVAALWISGCAASDPGIRAVGASSFTFVQDAAIRGDASRKSLALIFTGGEHGGGTEFILDALRDADIKAAFFVTGDYIAKPEYGPLLRRIVAEGHYLGPHSHGHPLYCSWEDRTRTLATEAEFKRDLQRNIDELRGYGALPAGELVYFIPPYEWYNADQTRWAREMGVTLFNFTPGSGSNRDWIPESDTKFVSSETILRDILAYEENDARGLNGFLLLLHLGSQRRDEMYRRLPELIAELRRRGYEFARVDELLR